MAASSSSSSSKKKSRYDEDEFERVEDDEYVQESSVSEDEDEDEPLEDDEPSSSEENEDGANEDDEDGESIKVDEEEDGPPAKKKPRTTGGTQKGKKRASKPVVGKENAPKFLSLKERLSFRKVNATPKALPSIPAPFMFEATGSSGPSIVSLVRKVESPTDTPVYLTAWVEDSSDKQGGRSAVLVVYHDHMTLLDTSNKQIGRTPITRSDGEIFAKKKRTPIEFKTNSTFDLGFKVVRIGRLVSSEEFLNGSVFM